MNTPEEIQKKKEQKEKRSKIIRCICGCNITVGGRSKHYKTYKHNVRINNIIWNSDPPIVNLL